MAFTRALPFLAVAGLLLAAANAQDCPTIWERADINGDHAVNVIDAVMLVRWTLDASLRPVPDPNDPCPLLGDLNADGTHNVIDAVQLIQLMLNPPPPPDEDDEDDGDSEPLPGGEDTNPRSEMVSDPHFVGFNGAKYDVTGSSGKYYAIVSDAGLAINAKFETAWTTGASKVGDAVSNMMQKGTWVTEAAIIGKDHSVVVSTRPAPGVGDECEGQDCIATGSLVVDGHVVSRYGLVPVEGFGTVEAKTDGTIVVSSPTFEVAFKVAGPMAEWSIPEAETALYSHINLAINKIDLSEEAHGLLGYTTRAAAGTSATDKDGQGVIEGEVSDYEVSKITDTKFAFSKF